MRHLDGLNNGEEETYSWILSLCERVRSRVRAGGAVRKWVGLVLAIRACVRGLIGNVVVLKRNNTQKKNKDGVNGWLVICYVSSEIWRERERGELVTLPLHKYAGSVCVSTTHKHCTSIAEFFVGTSHIYVHLY